MQALHLLSSCIRTPITVEEIIMMSYNAISVLRQAQKLW